MAEPLSGRADVPATDGRGGSAIKGAMSPRGSVRDTVERAVREALLTGRFVPGRAVTLRGLAQELGVSPMPVREAVRALSAGNALEIRPNGRIQVPTMTRPRLEEILKARLLLEPELAGLAGPGLNRADAAGLAAIDDRIDASLDGGDAETYMRLNHALPLPDLSCGRIAGAVAACGNSLVAVRPPSCAPSTGGSARPRWWIITRRRSTRFVRLMSGHCGTRSPPIFAAAWTCSSRGFRRRGDGKRIAVYKCDHKLAWERRFMARALGVADGHA